jgi:hexulose-6-phosphate isomerase
MASNRREFCTLAAGAAAQAWARAESAPPGRFRKGICAGIFPRNMPYAECFRQAKNAGFDGIELPMAGEITLESSPAQLEKLRDEARKSGVTIVSVWVSPLGATPLNSPDPAVRSRGVEAIRTAVDFAKLLDCEVLLVVPGRVGSGAKFQVGYETTWERFTVELKKAIPYAERGKVVLGLENVSNRFLVSPLEMRAFIDQFKSPWLQSYFDIGNVMYFGYPQDWILTLGPRIKRVHVKNRKATPAAEARRPSGLLEGDVDWKEVMAALVKVGYRGFLSPEIGHDPQDPDQLKNVSAALDKILAMA